MGLRPGQIPASLFVEGQRARAWRDLSSVANSQDIVKIEVKGRRLQLQRDKPRATICLWS